MEARDCQECQPDLLVQHQSRLRQEGPRVGILAMVETQVDQRRNQGCTNVFVSVRQPDGLAAHFICVWKSDMVIVRRQLKWA